MTRKTLTSLRPRRVSSSATLLLAAAALVWLAAPVAAQQESASIIGQVVDESGAVIPGVTVTASGPSLQVGSVAAVTDEHGDYRLTPLPIGTYTVTYTLSGFQTLKREGIRLTAGFAARVDAALKLGALEETVVVSGASPVVDVTSTATTTQLTRETLELTPTGRNGIVAVLAQVPGVRTNLDVGGSTINDTPSFRAYGQSQEAWGTLEGVLTTSPKDTQSGNYYDYASFEEAKVEAIGKNAEVPNRGIQMAAIVKSGGNNFHGNYYGSYTSGDLQSNNISDELAARGITSGDRIQFRRDISGDLGGRIVRDKLWFYVGARDRAGSEEVLEAFKPDGSPATNTQKQSFQSDKVNYQLSQSNRIVGFYNWSYKHENRGVTLFVPYESRTDQTYVGHTAKAEWQAVHGNSFVTSLQFGHWRWRADYLNTSPNVATIDRVTQYQAGDNTNTANVPGEWRHHLTGTASWYRPNLLWGNHDFKGGFDYLDTTVNRAWESRGPSGNYGNSGNYRLGFRSGVPDVIETYNYPVDPLSASHYLGIYLRDSWTIARRLTLNVGLRYAHDRGFVPAQCRIDAEPKEFAPAQCYDEVNFNTWNTVAPRAAASYDLAGNGKTVVKGGWGRFDHMREIEEVLPANRNIAATTTWRWHDNNGNKKYDAGEVNLDPNGADFVSVANRDTGLFSNGIPNANEKEPKVDQYNASVEHEIMPNFAVRGTWIYSSNFNVYRVLNTMRPYDAYNVPFSITDPGPDGRVGTPDDPGVVIQTFDYPATLTGVRFQVPTLFNDPNSEGHYTSYEFAASKRISNRWQMMASYSTTRLNVPHSAESNYNPISEINDGSFYREWLGKVSGVYIFPKDVSVAVNYDHRSGTPQARTLSVAFPRSGNVTVSMDRTGTIRLPNTNLVDLRVEKSFRVAGSHRITARLNVYNLLNAGTVTARTTLSGANYLRPTAIAPPRILDIGGSYSF